MTHVLTFTVLALGLLASLSGCRRTVAPLVEPRQSAVALTGGPNTSMIYLARTTDGVLAIDLGWPGHRGALLRGLDSLKATPADVKWVFLTHSHRDHIGAWRDVRHARFHVSAAERPALVGLEPHRGWLPRWSDRLDPPRLPRPGELAVVSFSGDTTLLVGADTVRAYLVRGHTAGSVVYLFRGVLFLGDAVTYGRLRGFGPPMRGVTDDRRAARDNLDSLWRRLPRGAVRHVCTAHARCVPFTSAFVDQVSR